MGRTPLRAHRDAIRSSRNQPPSSKSLWGRGHLGPPPGNLVHLPLLAPFASHWRRLDSSGHHFPSTANGLNAHPQTPLGYSNLRSLPNRTGAFIILKSLPLSRIVRATSAPHLLQAGPHPAPRLLCLKQGPCSTRGPGSREPAAWRAPTWEPAPEATTPRPPGPPSHSTALSPAPRSAQGDLALRIPTFLEEGKRDHSRQKNTAKRIMGHESGPSTYLQQEQERGKAVAPGSHGGPGRRRANTELGCGRAGPG